MPGPAPTPTNLLKARGSWRAGTRKGEPAALAASVPECPEMLSDGARTEWERIAPLVAAMKTTTAADLAVLAGYCVYFDAWCEAIDAKLAFEVGTIERRRVEISAKEAYGGMMTAAAKLGLSPSDRARVKEVGARGDEDQNKKTKARFFAGGAPLRIAK